MRRQLATSRRRWVLGTLAAAIVVLAVGASQGLAGASGNGTHTATAPVQYHNENCGLDNGKKFVGKARFTLSSNGTLGVSVQLTGADPGSYDVILFNTPCDKLGVIGMFKVGSSGTGSKVSQTCCYPSGSYFVNFENETTKGERSNDTLIVKL